MSVKLSDFDYHLPEHLIAQHPVPGRRDRSSLLVVDRKTKTLCHHKFCDIISFLKPQDLLVLNDTKVLKARLWGHRKTGGRVEILLLRPAGQETYQVLIRPLARLKDGEEIFLDKGFSCRLLDAKNKLVAFNAPGAREVMEQIGVLPLPPYIRRQPGRLDRTRYQTVFAASEGAVAAPTAGLHFTDSLLSSIRKMGAATTFLTLHVNYATFSPVRADDIRDHRMEPESFSIPKKTVDDVREATKRGGRVFAVGTTVCKALETAASDILGDAPAAAIDGASSLFIHSPYRFRVTDALVTNFHLPRTTLLMLVSAFAGRGLMLKAYDEAVKREYRFYSYGDAMLIL